MTILTMPATPGFAGSRFGLTSNTAQFRSPLTGQVQTLERPGARWQASYQLPPMKRADVARWQAFLISLRGQAGRFYGFDPDARNPRGAALGSASDSRNELRNGSGFFSVNGVIGAGGAAPSFWSFGIANGLMREIVGSGTDGALQYVDVRFSGVPTANFVSLSFEGPSTVAVAEGETWTGSFWYKLMAGGLTNIVAVNQRVEQLQGNGASLQSHYAALITPDPTWRRQVLTKTLTNTTPDTARLRNALHFNLTAGAAIDITLRLGGAQLEKQPAATVYIPTTSGARSRSAGPRIAGAGQAGSLIYTWNWQPNVGGLLRAGDYLAFDTPTGHALHLVTADASSDAEGRADLTIEPPLRTAPLDNAAIATSGASAIMALVEDSVAWEADAAGTYRLSFGAMERF